MIIVKHAGGYFYRLLTSEECQRWYPIGNDTWIELGRIDCIKDFPKFFGFNEIWGEHPCSQKYGLVFPDGQNGKFIAWGPKNGL